MTDTMPVLSVVDGRPMADSRDVARTFDRKHQHVLEAYRNLHCSDGFRQSNFRPFKIKDLTGESTSHVLMTRNGFAFLVLGFTGVSNGIGMGPRIGVQSGPHRERGVTPLVSPAERVGVAQPG